MTKRQENIAVHFDVLKQQIGKQEAIRLIMQLEMEAQDISFPKPIS
jgi:hypothetical protein